MAGGTLHQSSMVLQAPVLAVSFMTGSDIDLIKHGGHWAGHDAISTLVVHDEVIVAAGGDCFVNTVQKGLPCGFSLSKICTVQCISDLIEVF